MKQCFDTFGMIAGDTVELTDLPASGGTPVALAIDGDIYAAVNLFSYADFLWTISTTSALAVAKFAANHCNKVKAGHLQIPIVGVDSGSYLYVTSADAALTGGLSYCFVKGS